MQDDGRIAKAIALLSEFAQICRELPDEAMPSLFGDGTIEGFMEGILDPREIGDYPNIAEFFLAKRMRLTPLAALRQSITRYYSFSARKEDDRSYRLRTFPRPRLSETGRYLQPSRRPSFARSPNHPVSS